MELYEKFKVIREIKGLTQANLAKLLHCDNSLISLIENNKRIITSELLNTFKEVLNLKDVPLTTEEVRVFERELHKWIWFIQHKIDKAKEQHYRISHCIQWSMELHLRIFYELYSVAYYHSIGDFKASNDALVYLSENQKNFTDEQAHGYHRIIGVGILKQWKYKDALTELLKAEALDERIQWSDEFLYYNIALCLTNMGYSILAIEYIQKSQNTAIKENNIRFFTINQLLLAANYRNMGRYNQALTILEAFIHEEKSQANMSLIGVAYRRIAQIYSALKNEILAIRNIDKSLHYFERECEAYIYTMYVKANILSAHGDIEKCRLHIKNIYTMIKGTTISAVLTDALNCSLHLDNNSASHMEHIVIPKLLEYGLYIEVIEYYEKLSDYFKNNKKYKSALHFRNLAFEICKKLMKGDVIS